MTAHPSEDHLLDLAAGLVSDLEADGLLGHLRACADCEERFRVLCRELERAKLARSTTGSRRSSARWLWLAAAAIGATALIVPWVRGPAAPDPAAYWLPVDSEPVDLRTVHPDANVAAFADARDAYRRHDARRAVALLSGRPIPEGQDPLRLLYASALLHVGDARAALRELEALHVESLPQPYRDRAKWIKIGVLRGLSRDEEAKDLARDLAARAGEFAEAAKRID